MEKNKPESKSLKQPKQPKNPGDAIYKAINSEAPVFLKEKRAAGGFFPVEEVMKLESLQKWAFNKQTFIEVVEAKKNLRIRTINNLKHIGLPPKKIDYHEMQKVPEIWDHPFYYNQAYWFTGEQNFPSKEKDVVPVPEGRLKLSKTFEESKCKSPQIFA